MKTWHIDIKVYSEVLITEFPGYIRANSKGKRNIIQVYNQSGTGDVMPYEEVIRCGYHTLKLIGTKKALNEVCDWMRSSGDIKQIGITQIK